MSIGTFCAVSIFFIIILMSAVICTAVCYKGFEHKRNFVITEVILGAFLIILGAAFGSVNVKFSHPE